MSLFHDFSLPRQGSSGHIVWWDSQAGESGTGELHEVKCLQQGGGGGGGGQRQSLVGVWSVGCGNRAHWSHLHTLTSMALCSERKGRYSCTHNTSSKLISSIRPTSNLLALRWCMADQLYSSRNTAGPATCSWVVSAYKKGRIAVSFKTLSLFIVRKQFWHLMLSITWLNNTILETDLSKLAAIYLVQ